MARNPRYLTPPDPEQVLRRLYHIVMNGEHKDSVAAARLLLSEGAADATGPDADMLANITETLKKGEL